jgi:hypothetical protein
MTIKQKIKKLGYKIKIVPHEVIKDHIACYNIKYREKIIYPKVAKKLNIPLNEIWISERYKKGLDNILFHELREIKYRYMGYSEKEAHKKAGGNEK